MIIRIIIFIVAAVVIGGCTSKTRIPASGLQASKSAKDATTKNPLEWNNWLKKNYRSWYFTSSRLEKDSRIWPQPFQPDRDPVYAHNEIFIPNKTPREVFRIMTRSSEWINFYPNSNQPSINVAGTISVLKSLQPTSEYDWTTFGVQQKMKITEFIDDADESVLAWSGGSLGTSVYHRWIMRASKNGTQVITEECEQGVMPFLDSSLMNPALHAAHQLWLENLKKYILEEPLGDLFAEQENDLLEDPEILGLNLSWFNRDYAKTVEKKLADGVYTSIGAGGNSLIVVGESEAILIDTKFDLPFGINKGASHLHDWIEKNIGVPVTKIVNTHYHYDHTFGNHLYGPVQIYAHPRSLHLMHEEDNNWWLQHPVGFPNVFLTDEKTILNAGTHIVEVHHSLPAHTTGDVWIYLPAENIVMLGDLMFHTYYPFLEDHAGGSSIKGTIKMLRYIAQKYPSARYLPGHGPVCTSEDVLKYAIYLETMYKNVKLALSKGLDEKRAVDSFDLSQWPRKVLPSLHNGSLQWATARSAFLRAFHIIKKNGE